MSEWRPFCGRTECACHLPARYVCDEHKDMGAGRRRCAECGWPEPVHELRDEMKRAGLELSISAARVNAGLWS